MKKHLFIKLIFLLSVSSITLAQDSSSRVIRIPDEVLSRRLQQAPTITLVADRNPVQIREQIRFELLPEDITSNSSFTYTINFGDESQDVKENGKSYFYHEYRSAGSFKVSVSIDIPVGAEIFDPKPVMANTITMQVENVSLFVEPTIVEVGQTVSFETKFKSINKILRYNFNFGDNSSSGWIADQKTTHTYSKPEIYSAFAEINGLDGNSLYPIATSITKQVNVKIPFSVKLTADNFNAKVGDVITFTASSNRTEEALEYWFNFGDDEQTIRNIRPVITKMYTEPGDYKVSVQLALNKNLMEVSSVIPIKILPITINLNSNKTDLFVGDTITFTASTNSKRGSLEYWLKFGDNDKITVSDNPTINYAYSEPGNFTASVQIAINGKPITNLATQNITISPQIIVTLQADKPNAIEGEEIKFKAITSSTEDGFRYEFSFGDHTPSQTTNKSTISHSYLRKGNYTASVKIIKKGRVLSQSNLPIIISSRQYIVNLKVDKPDSHPGDTLTFTTLSNYHDIGLEYLFDFGDNTPFIISKDSIIQQVYNNQGNFTASVQLLLDNIPQTQDSILVRINLLPPPNSVSLLVEPDTSDTGNRFIFTAIANNQRSGLEYWFYTGDKNQPIRTLKDTIHYVYVGSGKYEAFVKLIVNGQQIAISSNVEINVMSNNFPWWLPAAVLIILGGGFLGRKYFRGKLKIGNNIPNVHPTFHPHVDKDFSKVKKPDNPNVNYEIHYDPNLANAIHLLKPKEENFIKSKTVKP